MKFPIKLLTDSFRVLVFLMVLATANSVFALPSEVRVSPPNNSRFLPGQRFDLRVEGKGTGPFSATLSIDGLNQTFTSGIQNSLNTDGITSSGYGGFNLRGYTNVTIGSHTITATFTDSTGTVTVTSRFDIIDVFPRSPNPFNREITSSPRNPIKNIIIMIGDGMGIAHRTAARIVKYGVNAGTPNGILTMDTFPGYGAVSTHSLNSIITDSAPGMSCYTTGNHQNNNQEGAFPANVINPFFAPRVEYLAEYLHRTHGKSLGLVTTADVEDATPAANAVHTLNRGAGTGIGDQYFDESDPGNTRRYGTGLSVLLGGGRRWFIPAGQFGSSRSGSNDYADLPIDLVAGWNLPSRGVVDPSRNLVQEFKNAGFTYAETASDLKSVGDVNKLIGLFAYGNMNVAMDKIAKRRGTPLPGATSYVVDDYRAPDQPMLDEMTDVALKVLSKNQSGFVLMVEGAHIDKQSHAMDAERAIGDTIEFDNAVAIAKRFADQAGDTLIIVTGDHECSGFSIIGALTGGIDKLKSLPADNAVLDPNVQPERQKVVGTYDAASFPTYKILADGYPESFDINGKLLVGYGANGDRFESWLTKPLPVRDSLLPTDLSNELTGKGYGPEPYQRLFEKNLGYFLRGQAVGQSQAVHTASDIPISAYSSGGKAFQLFNGVQQNTDVFFKIVKAVMGNY